jgi:hypothetical protein
MDFNKDIKAKILESFNNVVPCRMEAFNNSSHIRLHCRETMDGMKPVIDLLAFYKDQWYYITSKWNEPRTETVIPS